MDEVAVDLRLLLEKDDFCLFPDGRHVARKLGDDLDLRACRCGGRRSARIATFSYRKDLSTPGFQRIWEEAHAKLQAAERWLLVGYSLPWADIEIRHLLKTAQLGRSQQPTIDVVLKHDRCGGDRYTRFFGSNVNIFQGGLDGWISQRLEDYCSHEEPENPGASQ